MLVGQGAIEPWSRHCESKGALQCTARVFYFVKWMSTVSFTHRQNPDRACTSGTMPGRNEADLAKRMNLNSCLRARRKLAVLPVPLVLLAFILTARGYAISSAESLAGQLLVASPEMRDPRFVETVIYMVKDDSEGALGLVINRPLAKGPIQDLLKGFHADTEGVKGEIVIHYGGPVTPGAGFVLHSDDVLLDSSTRVKDGIAVTSDARLITAIGQGKGPRQALVMMGYAGWAPGQLEAELKAEAWFVVPADKKLIFGKDAEQKWRQALDKRRTPL
jgi:putative transcriptional regulator